MVIRYATFNILVCICKMIGKVSIAVFELTDMKPISAHIETSIIVIVLKSSSSVQEV
jgi:hypothetical protein